MMDKSERIQNRISPEVQEFRSGRVCLQLASIDANHFPHSSYAPFVYKDLCYYILISDLAIHGQNLKQNNKVGIALIDDETGTKDMFARRRLTYTAVAKHVERDSEKWNEIIDEMHTRAGETTAVVSQLQDFHLYCLQPIEGRYVKGFAKAFAIDAAELPKVTALDEDSHVIMEYKNQTAS